MFDYITAKDESDYTAAAELFKEYARWLNIDLSFQHFDEELLSLRSMYSLPAGGIILCKEQEEFVGCVGIRRIDEQNAEMKRMYVMPAFQRKGIASELLRQSVSLARDCGYRFLKLDTLNTMTAAMNLYTSNGFEEVPAYYYNPNETVVYFQKTL